MGGEVPDPARVAVRMMRALFTPPTHTPPSSSCGDCASPFKFTHAADWQARTAIRNMFLGTKDRHGQILTPWCTYTEPEIAHVGLYEKEMDDRGIKYV